MTFPFTFLSSKNVAMDIYVTIAALSSVTTNPHSKQD